MSQANLLYTLSRCDSGQLTEWLGASTVRLLSALNITRLTNTSLAKLVVAKYKQHQLLQKREFRGRIFKALSPGDAAALVATLGLDVTGDAWNVLLQASIPKGGKRMDALFHFFGIEPEEKEGAGDPSPAAPILPQYPLFPHQRAALCRTIDILRASDPPRVLLHMPTGAGKTRTAMNIIANILRSSVNPDMVVVWLAHSEELCDQASEEFKSAWLTLGDREMTVYRHYGSNRVEDLSAVRNGLLVGGLKLLFEQSLGRQSEFLVLARRTGLIVMDEAHQAVAPTYRHLLELLCPLGKTPLLGLSATPGRSFLNAGADLSLADFFAGNKVTLQVDGYENPMLYLQHEGYLARVTTIRLPYSPKAPLELTQLDKDALREGFDLSPQALSRLGEDELRNLLIVSKILLEAGTGSKIIVFACSVAHAILLADVLQMKGTKAAAVTSETSSKDRERHIEAYRHTDELQVLTNYGVLTAGFDAPCTSVAFICRPTQSVVLYSQMVGRAARGRRAGGNDECRVFTVVDNLPGVKDISEAFNFWEDIWN